MNQDRFLLLAIALLTLIILASGCIEFKDNDNPVTPVTSTNDSNNLVPTVKAKITDPYYGQTVKNEYTVYGTIDGDLPANSYLWLFVGEQAVNEWWPQGGGRIAPIINGNWTKAARIGGEPELDIGKKQQMIVMLVDEKVDKELNLWVEMGTKTGKWPGMRLPSGKDLDKIDVIMGKG